MTSEKEIRVLVVDDSIVSRRFISIYLTKIGITNVLEVSDGKKALELLEHENVDLILSDWMMPGMTGIDFLKSVRRDIKLKDVPFIMVTAEGLKASIAEMKEAGVTTYILKPYTFETFKGEIQSVLL